MSTLRLQESHQTTTLQDDLTRLPRLPITRRQLLDLEQILCGGFAPLRGFLNQDEYTSVVERMRLASGALWPIPIVFDQQSAVGRSVGERLTLCDTFGNPIAFFKVESIYKPDKRKEARLVYGTESLDHAGVRYLVEETGDVYLGGSVEFIARAPIFDFKELRLTPPELRDHFKNAGYNRVVAFQTRNPLHRGHFEIIKRTCQRLQAHALIHPVVGVTKEGDIDYIWRVRAYQRIFEARMRDFCTLALLPLAMRMAGPREAVWHALIRKNYGATHFIVGRDHAGSKDSSGKPFYGVSDSQNLAMSFASELGIAIEPVREIVYVESEKRYMLRDEAHAAQTIKSISGSQLREMLRTEEPIPDWFSFPEVIAELRKAARWQRRRGVVIFFTGLSGAGKTTIANTLYPRLVGEYGRLVTTLDGDIVRQNLSKGLGFTYEDRNINIERIGFVASEIAKHGGIALCAAIAAYKSSREKNRRLVEKVGSYIEVYVKTPLVTCETRDSKGLYRKARAGLLKHVSGIDDPYEEPDHPDLVIETERTTPEAATQQIIDLLQLRGLLKPLDDDCDTPGSTCRVG